MDRIPVSRRLGRTGPEGGGTWARLYGDVGLLRSGGSGRESCHHRGGAGGRGHAPRHGDFYGMGHNELLLRDALHGGKRRGSSSR